MTLNYDSSIRVILLILFSFLLNLQGRPSITSQENGTEGSMLTGSMTAESDPVMQIRKRHINDDDDDDDVEEVKCVKFKKKKEGYLKPKKTKYVVSFISFLLYLISKKARAMRKCFETC